MCMLINNIINNVDTTKQNTHKKIERAKKREIDNNDI